ncbi:hypothetical protein BJF84_22205 [Rhodococcus sp. CUA-806]|nr:hypothetical protein BJF84_22205 [Rhodococcus sp. CUA-806]
MTALAPAQATARSEISYANTSRAPFRAASIAAIPLPVHISSTRAPETELRRAISLHSKNESSCGAYTPASTKIDGYVRSPAVVTGSSVVDS